MGPSRFAKTSLCAGMAVLMSFTMGSRVQAQTSYISTADGDWITPTTWTPTGVPTYSVIPGDPTIAQIETAVQVTTAVGANLVAIENGSLTITGTGSISTADEIQLHTATLRIEAGGTIDPTAPFFAYDGSTVSLADTVTFAPNNYYVLDSTTVAVNAGTATISSAIRDYFNPVNVGSLTKTGAGTLILTGANSYSNGTTISGGTLEVGNSGALGTGSVTNNANLATNSTATGLQVNIGGNYAQSGGGTLTINLYGPGNSDSLNVAGTSTLDGTLALHVPGGFAPTAGDTYTIVTPNGGYTGQFATVTSSNPALRFGVEYLQNVSVIYQPLFANMGGLSPNQLSVANYLDARDLVITNGNFAGLLGALDRGSAGPSGVGGYLDQLTPVNFAQFTSSTAFNNTSFLTQQFDNYLANHRGRNGGFVSSAGGIDYSGLTLNDPNYLPGLQQVHSRLLAWNPAPNSGLMSDVGESTLGGVDMKDMKEMKQPLTCCSPNRWSAFVSGNAILAQNFSDPSASQSHQDLTTAAVQIGADYQVTPNLIFGAMFGYGHTDADLDNIGSTASVDTYSPAVYMSYANEGWYVNALGSYGFSNYTQDRSVSIGAFDGSAHSSPSGDQIVGNVDGGYDFHRGHWTFGPMTGLQYVHLDVDGYTESGLPVASLAVGDTQADSLRSRLGGRVSYTFQGGGLTFLPHLSASWQHEFMDQGRGISSQFTGLGAGSFVVRTEDPSRDSAIADVGVDAVINQSVTVFVDYAVQAGQDNYFGQSMQGGVKIGF
jgi:autotransporter-associated beta strand protein